VARDVRFHRWRLGFKQFSLDHIARALQGVGSGMFAQTCRAAIKVRTRDNQGEEAFCRLRCGEGEARPEAQATEHLA